MKLPPLPALRAFEAAGRLEHFSRAAEELAMTQAAVSYQIRQLEDFLGEKLFERERGRVRLSATGRRLHKPISEAFASMRAAFADLEQERSAILSISGPSSFGATWLSGSIGRFQLLYPDLALRLSLTNELVDLSGGDFDLAVRLGKGGWEGLREHFLFRLYVTPMCSPEFAESHKLGAPEDLLDVERISPDDPMWGDYFASVGIGGKPMEMRGIALENQSQVASAAKSGFGVALLTPLLWREEIENGSLVCPIDHIHYSDIAHFVVYPERRVGVRKIERFREWITRELARPELGIPQEALRPPGP